ncbi:uncharacterized protein LOC113146518 [Cyclospora cayetanensis]|uniref:Uncharacterized protein LOC113146518 n=1 Tax=Cyclospora cayetanensis TaxID=88456 RepID=A0A6P6RRX5_9EIME|nr:uncharacterized protein LOC113146518 [Cyclospora cayetanensis]
MMVKYEELSAVTIAPEHAVPSLQAILGLLSGAVYEFVLELEVEAPRKRMAPKDRWKTAFRSATGLFEYTRMPFGLKGATTALHPNINAYCEGLAGYTILKAPDFIKPYHLYNGASGSALRALLKQKNKSVDFRSQVMILAKQNYSISDPEFLALVTSLIRGNMYPVAQRMPPVLITEVDLLTHLIRANARM